ncbi:MAG: hypothetical protein GF317_15640 [Candidatus Lokiarchaeota archaeon]|nr:hypothetical protein [Candidatus Lokiarchaeota archaeon]MBD3200996.1 hypothetical protein [Candidatus Lokiarchaeota archaeon]
MKGIYCVFIVNERGTSIFSCEIHQNEQKDLMYSFLSNLFSTLKNFNLKTGEEGVNMLKLKEVCYYFIKDSFSDKIIALECGSNIKSDQVYRILKDIRIEYDKKYIKELYCSKMINSKLNNDFYNKIKLIVKLGKCPEGYKDLTKLVEC